MIKILSIILGLLLVSDLATAQAGDKKEKQLKEKQLLERQRSLGGQRAESDQIDEKGKTQGSHQDQNQNQSNDQQEKENNDQKNNDSIITPNKDQNPEASDGADMEENNNDQQAAKREKSNAPAIIQTTTSESGSPAVLSKDNGRSRDGTNNIQRSTYNMAGAKIPDNMNLAGKNAGGRNFNTGKRIRQQEDMPVRTNIQGAARKSSPSADDVGQSKGKSDNNKKQKRKDRKNTGKDS
jgi:hypothetical protein